MTPPIPLTTAHCPVHHQVAKSGRWEGGQLLPYWMSAMRETSKAHGVVAQPCDTSVVDDADVHRKQPELGYWMQVRAPMHSATHPLSTQLHAGWQNVDASAIGGCTLC